MVAEQSVQDVFLELASMPHVTSGCEYQDLAYLDALTSAVIASTWSDIL